MLSRLEEELKSIVQKATGVENVIAQLDLVATLKK